MKKYALCLLACLVASACREGGCESDSASPAPDLQRVIPDSSGEPEDMGSVETEADIAVEPRPEQELAGYVNPFIGTDGSGNVIPGPGLPHGTVKLSPDCMVEKASIDAYEYDCGRIEGFSHTHLEGPGGSGYGYSEIMLMPVVGADRVEKRWFDSAFGHANETAKAGFYSVLLDDFGVQVELSATHRTGVHRYTFPGSDETYVVLDLGHTRGRNDDGRIEVVDGTTLEGHAVYSMHPILQVLSPHLPYKVGVRTIYFVVRFDAEASGVQLWNKGGDGGDSGVEGAGAGAAVRFDLPQGGVVEARVGISFVSLEQARMNLDTESAGRTFEEVRTEAFESWNKLLNRVQITAGEEFKEVFYTGLYHTLLQPVDYSEYGRFWTGFDGQGVVVESEDMHYYSDDWCAWDTFRTSHPLQVLLEPERARDQVASYLLMFEQGGWLPKCPWQATGYSRVMIGNHVSCFITDSLQKGVGGIDTDLAWEAVYKHATQDDLTGIPPGVLGFGNYGTLPSYMQLGYVPYEDDNLQAVSLTLEFAYNDWCAAVLASSLGKEDKAQYLLGRAGNYKNHWDPETGFMRPRMKNGTWFEPFDPTKNDVGFCEADSWIYTWFVPQDPAGLVALFGGSEPFVDKLDQFFDEGHYDPTNQPDFHASWLYSWAGRPDRTQLRVRDLVDKEFTTAPNGLPGNDDAGAMSAWMVLAALGLYPVAPGAPYYVLNSPTMDEAVLQVAGTGNPVYFRIVADNNSPDNRYVQEAFLNGEELPRPWLTHDEITAGGELVLTMGPAPSTWGSAPEHAPPSLFMPQ